MIVLLKPCHSLYSCLVAFLYDLYTMISTNRVKFLFILSLFASTIGFAQPVTSFKIAKSRLIWHDKVDAEQKRLQTLTSRDPFSEDSTIALQMTYTLEYKVDGMQKQIEQDSTLADIKKVKYLRGLEFLIRGYNDNYKKPDFPPTMAPALIDAYKEAMELDRKGESIAPVVEKNIYGIGEILIACFRYPEENKGVAPSRTILLRKYLLLHPTKILETLRSHLNIPFADSLIVVAARRDLHKFYDFASASDALSALIGRNTDPFVRTLYRMAKSKSGMLYFPFIDKVASGNITFEDIDKVKDNPLNYYRLMVKTRIEYAGRVLNRDTPMEMSALTQMMTKKAKEYFINEINGLHDQPDAKRFQILEPLTSQELYYLAVLGEDEIYTSSYVRGVFPRIFQRMKVPRADSLIMSVNGDYFRKFIKMAANYNTLDTVLKSMPKDNANTLMRTFMFGLEKTITAQNVEDAVDVADSYSSIVEKNRVLADFMLKEAIGNYKRCEEKNDKNGQLIYRLCKILFESADTSKKVNLSALLGIPPVYDVDYKSLTDDSGRVVQQVFFYGDKDNDGQNSYASFMSMFLNKPSEWSISENPNWVSIKSVKGKPVWIFANKPLYGENDPDDAAKDELGKYLESKKLTPTIFIHRGHSYHVKSSLARLKSRARIVVLGSCGGYNNLNEVLTISPDAHIISSKQTGTRTVNEPILQAINNDLRNGRNVDWLPMWRQLGTTIKAEYKELFDDYVPPYKNLGAIFIKAYRKGMEQ